MTNTSEPTMTGAPDIPRRLVYSPKEVAEFLGIGRTKLYELLSSGRVRSIKIGGHRRIPAVELHRVAAEGLA